MSQSDASTGLGPVVDPGPEQLRRVTDQGAVQDLLDVLDDGDCRAILGATTDDALSASELADRCGLPLSTTYRKIELLDDVGALAERTRFRPSGKHTSEYRRVLNSVVVSVGRDGGTELLVSLRDVE